jgi:hypothetical protein
VGAALGACHVVAGIDHDYREVACEELGQACVEAPPAAWNGPLMLLASADGSEPYLCPNGSSEVKLLGSDPAFDLAGCGCAPPNDACTVKVTPGLDANCALFVPSIPDVPTEVCFSIDLIDQWVKAVPNELNQVRCIGDAGGLPAPNWKTRARICQGPASFGTCDADSICTKADPQARQCIMQTGDVDCPAGPYSGKQVFFESFSDRRRCECGAVTGSCRGTLAVFTTLETCQDKIPVLQGAVGDCFGPVSATSMRYTAVDADLACTVDVEDALKGDVVPAGPVTFCCLPEG